VLTICVFQEGSHHISPFGLPKMSRRSLTFLGFSPMKFMPYRNRHPILDGTIIFSSSDTELLVQILRNSNMYHTGFGFLPLFFLHT